MQSIRGMVGGVLSLALCWGAASVQAANFVVDNVGSQDDGDAFAPGNDDSVCDIDPNAGGAHCTLRAAIQEANDTPGSDTITFAAGVTAITLTIGLPSATTPMIIDGANANAVGQRVDINGGGTNSAFDFNSGAQGSTIRNLVIRNFNDDGIAVAGHGYTIDNNYIGVMPSGLTVSKNSGDGISITGVAGPPANIPTLGLPSDLVNIATITADIIAAFASIPPNTITTNVVSGNDGDGIEVFSENAAVNIISNNKVGTSANGLLAIPNGTGGGDGHGIRINSFAYANVVGPGNIVSGNNSDPNSHGIALVPGAVRYPNFVAGNIVGPSSAIVAGLGNSADGIYVDTRPQTTTAPLNPTNYAAFIGPGNIVGYNGDDANIADPDLSNGNHAGIHLTGSSTRVRVLGNFVGVGEDPLNNGTFVNIGNNGDGIRVNTSDHEIGGSTFPEANIVSSNKRHGIAVNVGATHTVKITGNIIGRDPLNLVDQSNDADGIRIFESSGIQIGGTGSGEGNVIAGNLRHGIKIGTAASSGSSNLIARNEIFGNGDLGIDLDRLVNDPDPIPDPLDPDPNLLYANDGQNQPLICDGTNVPACAAPGYDGGSGATALNWRLSSAPNTDYVFEVFASDSPDASGWGEGQTYIGTFNATTDGAGVAGGSASITPSPAIDTQGMYLSMTVRPVNLIDPPGPSLSGPANNSSEFSNAVKVPVPGTLQFSSATYSVAENAMTATITVTRTGGSDGTVGVTYATSDGTATAPADYAATTNTLTWADGDMADQTFVISIADDGIDETDETVSLALSAPSGGATLGTPSAAVLTVTDNDAEPTLSIGDVAMAEGQAGQTAFTFTITLAPASGKTVTVNAASADNTATLADSDYVLLGATPVTFNPGVTSQQVVVNVNGDANTEGDESFFVNLSGALNATLSDAQAIGTIIDDEAAIVTVNDVSVVEGDVGTSLLNFTLARSDATGPASVDVTSADGTATAGIDYVALATTTVTFLDGEASRPVSITVNGDTTFEPAETVLLNLSNPVNLSIADAQGVGTINNDDAQPSIAIDDVTLAEGQVGTTAFTFTVTLSNPSSETVTVSAATADGTATLANSDYVQLMPTALTFVPGDTSETVVVNVNGDTATEGNESFQVNLSAAGNASIGDAQGLGTIVDDEAPVFMINDVAVNEGNAGTSLLTFTVTRTPGDGASSVTVASADGTATTADADYVALPATVLNFADTETTQQVSINIGGDLKFEANETVLLNLSSAVNASIGDAQGVGTINNDDTQPSISIGDVTLAEGQAGTTAFTFTVTLSNPSDQTVSVTVASSDGSATIADGDYLAFGPLVLVFNPGQTSQQVTVSVLGDTKIEPQESFNLSLSMPVNATLGDASALGIITADDFALPPNTPIPTLSRMALVALAGLFALIAVFALRRRHHDARHFIRV